MCAALRYVGDLGETVIPLCYLLELCGLLLVGAFNRVACPSCFGNHDCSSTSGKGEEAN